MKYTISLIILVCFISESFSSDTLIYSSSVTLDTVYSQYDNVEVIALTTIILDAGFTFSSNGNGVFTATADPYNIEDPLWTLPEGTTVDSTGTLDGAYVVGTIQGQSGVSPSGAASYSIPIEVPVGNKGMEPRLSVNYNSQAGNGIFGRGWNLGGISSITATGKTRYYDNESTAISSQDTACRVVWDGQRLFALNNSGLEADSFRTEQLSNAEITTDGSGNSLWFTVKTPDGRTMEYGNSTDSRLVLGDSTQWRWMLNRMKDRNGNTIDYTYTKDESIGEVLLSEIEYCGSTSSPVNKITLHYTTRTDLNYAYIHDDIVIQDQLLDSISTESNGDYYGSYGFRYGTNGGESLLDQIVQYDKDNYRFNATSVSWVAPTSSLTPTETTKTIIDCSGDTISYFTGDFTGDGIFDLVAVDLDVDVDSFTYYLYKGTSTGLPSTWDETGNLPRSYTTQYWESFTDYIESSSGCNYSGSPPIRDTSELEDILYVFSGDFDGDGIEELFVKVMEWDELSDYLPTDLNEGFTGSFLTDFGGFLDSDDICNLTSYFTTVSPPHMLLTYGIGHFLNFDESPTSDSRLHSFRLGQGSKYDEQYSQFPDIDGRGYNSFPDNNSIVYYDPVSDTAIAFATITADDDLRWAELNGDAKADYIDPADSTFRVYTFTQSDSSFTSGTQYTGYLLGTIDLNGDGVTAFVALDQMEFESLLLSVIWSNLGFESSDISNNTIWNNFLADFEDVNDLYINYVNTSCSGVDNVECRQNYLLSHYGDWSLGRNLYIDHHDDHGPRIDLGYFTGSHEHDDPLFTRATAVDIDADGKNELLLFSQNQLVNIYHDFSPSYSAGDISMTCQTEQVDEYYSFRFQAGDFNGDGILELIFPKSDKLLSFASGKPGKLVSSISNGVGIESRYTYSPLTDTDVYTSESDASFPVIDFSAPWYVVSRIASDNGVADSSYVDYNYEGGKIHLQGKGFLGYMRTEQENGLLSKSQIDVFDLDTSCFHRYPVSSTQKSGANNVSITNSYVSIDSLDSFYYNVVADSVKIQDALKGTTTTIRNSYSNGLLEEKETQYGNDASITKSYAYTAAGWHIAASPSSIDVDYKRDTQNSTDSTFLTYSSTTGNLIQKKEFCGTDRELTTKYLNIDTYGNPKRLSITGKKGQNLATDSVWIRRTYSADGRFLTTKIDTLEQKDVYQYDYSTGVLESHEAPNRKTTSYEYGPFNQRKKTIYPDHMEESAILTWANDHDYAPSGSLYYKWEKGSSTPEVYTFYDEVGRELRTVARGFSDEVIYTDSEYDSQGRVSRRSQPYISGQSQYWTSYTYDSYGRISKDSSANSIVSTYSYSGLETQVSVTDGDSTYTSSKEVNALGETIESTDDASNTIYHLYYPDGKRKESYVSEHSSDNILITYDAQGNRSSITDPDAGTILTLYDAFGNLLREINAKDDTTTFQYDAFGRVINQSDHRGDIFYTYIADTTKAAFGLIDSVYNEDKVFIEASTFDPDYGRLLTTTNRQSGKTFTNTYTYDWYGRPMTRIYPSGFEIEYAYTSNGDLDEVSGDGLTLWDCSGVNALGQITGYSQGGYSTEVTYDNYGEMTHVETGSILDWIYDFNKFGNLISRDDDITNQEEKFTYDNLNRLTNIEYYYNDTHISTADLTMGYDGCGNITSKTRLSEDIDYGEDPAGPHALTTINDPDTSYVPMPQSILYTCFNKVSSITDTLSGDVPLTLDFSYGLNNQRIKTTRTRNSTIEQVKYFDIHYEEDSTSAGVKKYHYIYGGNGICAIFVKQGVGNDTMFHVFSDHLGSLTTIVNASTSTVKRYSFNAWGIPRDATDWTTEYTGELFSGRGFTGHEHLTEFSLINMNGRIYDPILGRFLSPDPYVQMPDYPNSFNRYTYALNNPLRFIDPSGYKYGPSQYERDQANGQGYYYNYEMAWKLGGDGRLRPDPYTWNNIGRFHHTPGPTGTTTNSAGNTVNTYQDPITGGDYYWDSQEWEGDQSVRIVYEIEASSETEYSSVEHIRRDFGVVGTMIFLNPFSNVFGPELAGSIGDWLNKIGNLGQRKWTDPETGTGYYINDRGRVTGIYPTIGIARTPGKAGLKGGIKAFKHGFRYAKRVRGRALQDPVSHNFPYSFDDAILNTQPLIKNNGYKIFQKVGTMNGKTGVFEIGLTRNGIIDHRFFRPY